MDQAGDCHMHVPEAISLGPPWAQRPHYMQAFSTHTMYKTMYYLQHPQCTSGRCKARKNIKKLFWLPPLPLQLPHGELERVPGFTAGEDPPEALPSDQNGGRHVPVHETVCRWSSVADKEGSLRVNQFIPKTCGALKDLFWVGKWSQLNLPLQRQVHFDIF